MTPPSLTCGTSCQRPSPRACGKWIVALSPWAVAVMVRAAPRALAHRSSSVRNRFSIGVSCRSGVILVMVSMGRGSQWASTSSSRSIATVRRTSSARCGATCGSRHRWQAATPSSRHGQRCSTSSALLQQLAHAVRRREPREVAGAAGDEVVQHHHPPLAASGRIGGLDDVEVVRIAAEHLAQPEQQGGAERRPDRPVDQRDRRDQEPHRLGTQLVGQRERGPPVGVGLLPLPAPAPMPGLGPLPDAALRQRDDPAVAAGVEQRGRDLLPRDHAGGAAPLAGAEVQPPDVGRPQHLGAERVAVELPGGADDVVALRRRPW